jgi:hypothetical protein
MTKKTNPKRRNKTKPGPKEERLIIHIDPQEAIKALLKKQPKSSR